MRGVHRRVLHDEHAVRRRVACGLEQVEANDALPLELIDRAFAGGLEMRKVKAKGKRKKAKGKRAALSLGAFWRVMGPGRSGLDPS